MALGGVDLSTSWECFIREDVGFVGSLGRIFFFFLGGGGGILLLDVFLDFKFWMSDLRSLEMMLDDLRCLII